MQEKIDKTTSDEIKNACIPDFFMSLISEMTAENTKMLHQILYRFIDSKQSSPVSS